MNKYTFKLLEAKFTPAPDAKYNIVMHKILNEEIENIRIIIHDANIKDASEKALKELNYIIMYNFQNFPLIGNYNFQLKLISTEVE